MRPLGAERVRQDMDQAGLWPRPGAVAILAVSGGLDSTCMARLLGPELIARGNVVVVAHASHGLRPEAEVCESAFVEELARELGMTFVGRQLVLSEDLRKNVGLEAAAREARRRWLEELAAAQGSDHVFLAHHQDDQLETILLRRQEGVPASRAAGMSQRLGVFCRPLLAVPRTALEALARRESWTWHEDLSNGDLRFRRNELRHVLIPARRAADPHWAECVLAEGRRAAARREQRLAELEAEFADLLESAPGRKNHLPRARFAAVDLERLVDLFQRLCSPELPGDRPPSRAALEQLAQSIQGDQQSRVHCLGAGWTARVSKHFVELVRAEPLELEGSERQDQPVLPVGGTLRWDDQHQLGSRTVSGGEARQLLSSDRQAGKSFALFDPSEISGPIRIRPCGQGEGMQPFGMVGRRRLRDLLGEAGVPRHERAGWPMVVDASGEVLWLPGIRASHHAPISENSDTALMLYTVAVSDGAPIQLR
ncbi:MAG: tRNA lysidine(34) synthetase TilS [Myxococcota bacterium]|nr:tRNA lysidine(34) synthetase TilS [Myxococcota bacterium]